MSKNIFQVYQTNPITTNQGSDLMYFGRSPYGIGDDTAMQFSDFAAQFGAPYAPSALTRTDDTNVTLTLGGTPATALLQAVSLTLGWTGVLSPVRGGTGVNNGTNTLTLAGSLTTTGAFSATFNFTGVTNVTFPTSGTLATTAQIPTVTPSALTATPDINVTISLGGTPATALLQATSITLGWTGQLSVPRGGTGASSFTAFSVLCGGTTSTGALQSVVGLGNIGEQLTSNGPGALPTWQAGTVITPAAMTKTDDTNVTLTLGGSPSTSLLAATSLTLGWTGLLSPARGGTGVNNGTNTLTLAGNLATSGAFASTFTMTGATNVTFPTSGTLATTGNTVASIAGTLNQVLANGTSGSAQTGAVTLTTPQDIAPTSTPKFVNSIPGYTSITSAAGTTTLTTTSNYVQQVVGTTTQTIQMPVTSTLQQGQSWQLINNSTGVVTVNSSGGNLIITLAANTSCIITCILTSGTTAASWTTSFSTSGGGSAVITPWVAYTPTLTGFGTATGVSFFSRRVGDAIEIMGRFTPGTTTAVEARCTLGYNGGNANISSDATIVPSLRICGPTAVSYSTAAVAPTTLIGSGLNYLNFGAGTTGNAGTVPINGNAFGSVTYFIQASVPVTTWP